MPQRVLIIEDEPDIVELVCYTFRKEGYEVVSFARGKDGLEYLRRNGADLVLLDIMLPDQDGLEICRSIRADDRWQTVPLIFLTAKGEEIDRVVGLEIGADDYVVKPFSPRELVARAKAVLRRQAHPSESQQAITVGELRLDPDTHEVTVRGGLINLSALEFRLLQFLASHPRQVFSRERLLDQVWGADVAVTPRAIDVHIRRLREKIEVQADTPEYIQTVRGAGYRFSGQPPRKDQG